MAAIAITAANVIAQAGATIDRTGIAGETITAGQAVIESSTGLLVKTDADVAGLKGCEGIALNSASASQPLAIIKRGPVAMGAVFTAGLVYYLSPTAGGICLVADIVSGVDSVVIGQATSTTVLNVDIQDPDVTI